MNYCHPIYHLLFFFDQPPKFQDKENILELMNTHTYYYLAQVYEKTNQPSKSAECCYITLRYHPYITSAHVCTFSDPLCHVSINTVLNVSKSCQPANPPSSLADVIYGWFLSKQLALKQFQHLDWATNASMLSQHYLANEDYSTTKRHLIG